MERPVIVRKRSITKKAAFRHARRPRGRRRATSRALHATARNEKKSPPEQAFSVIAAALN
jgi:hypothetical protein